MNIICNNCIGARLYEINNYQFPNPFMWMIISIDDFIKLINNYDNLNLNNPKFELEYYHENIYKSVLITLEYNIKLHYIHYIQNNNKDIPTKELNTDILYKDIISYSKNKWFNRLNRSNEYPIFLYSFNNVQNNNELINDFNKLINIKNKEVYILINDKFNTDNYILNNNIHIIKLSSYEMNLTTGEIANLIKKYFFI